VQRNCLHVLEVKVAGLRNYVIEDTLRLRQISFGHVRIRNTDLHRQHALAVAHGVSDISRLGIRACRGFPVAVTTCSTTHSDVCLDGELCVPLGT